MQAVESTSHIRTDIIGLAEESTLHTRNNTIGRAEELKCLLWSPLRTQERTSSGELKGSLSAHVGKLPSELRSSLRALLHELKRPLHTKELTLSGELRDRVRAVESASHKVYHVS